jgi:hypothetical protein
LSPEEFFKGRKTNPNPNSHLNSTSDGQTGQAEGISIFVFPSDSPPPFLRLLWRGRGSPLGRAKRKEGSGPPATGGNAGGGKRRKGGIPPPFFSFPSSFFPNQKAGGRGQWWVGEGRGSGRRVRKKGGRGWSRGELIIIIKRSRESPSETTRNQE